MFAILPSLFGRSNATEKIVGGSDAVFEAILERSTDGKRYVVTFGEPQLVDRGGDYSQDYMAQIPTSTAPGDPEPPNIEYNLPDPDETLEESSDELFNLLDVYDIGALSDLGDLEGETVIATFEQGTLTLRFDELEGDDE